MTDTLNQEDVLANKLTEQLQAHGPMSVIARGLVFDTLKQVSVRLDLLTMVLGNPEAVTPILETMTEILKWTNQSSIDMHQAAGETRQ